MIAVKTAKNLRGYLFRGIPFCCACYIL